VSAAFAQSAVSSVSREQPASITTLLVARDVMTAPVVTVSAGDSLWSAWTMLHGFGLRHIVVVRGNLCIGVLDDRQIALQWPLGALQGHPVTAGELVRPRVRSVQGDTPVSVVAQIMLDECIDAVPVVSPRGEIHGLVTVSDLLGLLAGTKVTPVRGPAPLGAGS
jgi:CBS-domain-containing membrane protein